VKKKEERAENNRKLQQSNTSFTFNWACVRGFLCAMLAHALCSNSDG